ncbi:hypothetical protein BDV23DRAFT_145400 [Aspergillus alliaceus]|uniref:Uncharacterized protein n=1 Tax=Petromyces alliaceus TaxID=209559 RepID=A0A5N7CLZ3_PETAA|nr:hypothetical protein BDV23DRAFT_145400 [Aspergillus alliaceus]
MAPKGSILESRQICTKPLQPSFSPPSGIGLHAGYPILWPSAQSLTKTKEELSGQQLGYIKAALDRYMEL